MEEKESIAKAEESISKVLAHINIALKQIKCERVIEEKLGYADKSRFPGSDVSRLYTGKLSEAGF